MPKNDLKYGTAPFAPADNPQPRALDPTLQLSKAEITEGGYEPEPTAEPVDLRHIVNMPFANNDAAMKRWFLTAFVREADRHLIQMPDDLSSEALATIQQ